jgi:hypothetical protein
VVPEALSCSREEDIFYVLKVRWRKNEEERRRVADDVFKKEGWCHGPEPEQLPGT